MRAQTILAPLLKTPITKLKICETERDFVGTTNIPWDIKHKIFYESTMDIGNVAQYLQDMMNVRALVPVGAMFHC